MHTNRNAIVYGLSAGSGLPGHIRFSRSEYRYSMLWFSLIIGFLQKKYTENSEVMKFFILSLSLSLSLSLFAGFHTFSGLFRFSLFVIIATAFSCGECGILYLPAVCGLWIGHARMQPEPFVYTPIIENQKQ